MIGRDQLSCQYNHIGQKRLILLPPMPIVTLSWGISLLSKHKSILLIVCSHLFLLLPPWENNWLMALINWIMVGSHVIKDLYSTDQRKSKWWPRRILSQFNNHDICVAVHAALWGLSTTWLHMTSCYYANSSSMLCLSQINSSFILPLIMLKRSFPFS